MIKRIYLSILVLLFATSGVFAQVPTLKIGDTDAVYGPGIIKVPVYMQNFTNVDAFQLAFTYDADVINPLGVPESGRFVAGPGKVWVFNVNEGNFVVTFMDFGLVKHTINGKAFDLELRYSGGFPTDINFKLDNTQIMINGVEANLGAFTFVNGSVKPDPTAALGTLKLGTVVDAIIGTEVTVPLSLVGPGFTAVQGMQFELTFSDNELVYNGVDVVPGSGVAFDVTKGANFLKLVWIGTPQDFSTEKVVANIRFTYNTNVDAEIDFAPAPRTEVSSSAGALAWDRVKGVVKPKDLDLKLKIADKYQYSGANVDVPVVMSGVADAIKAGAITLRIGFDHNLMEFASFTSDLGFTQGASVPGILVLNLVNPEGVTLTNGTVVNLRFNFKQVGKSNIDFLFGTTGTRYSALSGGAIPITYQSGSAEVTVPGNIYDALMDAKSKTTFTLADAGVNAMRGTVVYPAAFITSDALGFPVLTDVWKVDAKITSTVAIPAGTMLKITKGDNVYNVTLASAIAANQAVYLSDLVKMGNPDAVVRESLLSFAGKTSIWNVEVRSAVTFETTFSVSHVTSHDGFTTMFELGKGDLVKKIWGDPKLVFAVNGVNMTTDATFTYCFGVPFSVTVAQVLEGAAPFTVKYTVNGTAGEATGVGLNGVVYGPVTPAAGTYAFVVTEILDAQGRSALNPQNEYKASMVVLPAPVLTCKPDTIVMLSHPAFDLTGSTPTGGTYSGTGVAAGKFTASVAGVGDHTITYTYTDANGCTATCTFKITVRLDTSVPEVPQTALRLFPNPVRNVLTIESGELISEIRMIDMLGQVVYTANVQDVSHELNVSQMKSGIYFVQVLTEKGFTTHRVQVTK